MPEPVVDLPALRAYLVAHAVDGVDEVEVGPDGCSRHRRLVATPGGALALEVTLPAEEVGSPVVAAAPVAGASGDSGPGPEDVATALAAGRRWLGLDADPAPAVAALADDPVLGPLVRARPHLRVPGTTGPFEAAVNVVLGQHVSLAAGRVFAGRLVATHGSGRPGGRPDDPHGTRLVRYPDPEALAVLDPEALRAAVGVTGPRAHTLVSLARAVAEGGLDLDPTEDADRRARTRDALLALPGVGPWTADLVALRCLRDPDVFLPGDLVLRRAMGGVSAREAGERARAWTPHRSLAVLHLWTHHALDPPHLHPPRRRPA
ncbi:DNA-3-methyladenine glycosylase 2 [Oryzobacter terrae]|uniref:DNA-3-methyladenine glycosylase 2 n=1 Tax=Oryzobacter terrae TaxID=1620385 RepID=UPI00367072A0